MQRSGLQCPVLQGREVVFHVSQSASFTVPSLGYSQPALFHRLLRKRGIPHRRKRTSSVFYIRSYLQAKMPPTHCCSTAMFASWPGTAVGLSSRHPGSRKCAKTPARLRTDLPAPTSPLAAAQCASVVSRLTRL